MLFDEPLAFTEKDNETVKNNRFVKHLKNQDALRANIVYDDDKNEIPDWMKQAASKHSIDTTNKK